MRQYFLGMAAEYDFRRILKHTFARGREIDCSRLRQFLASKYGGETMLCKNGRSALALALKAYFEPGDAVIINGFTCYAVYEAVKAAKLIPIFADISKDDLNFEMKKFDALLPKKPKGIIVQNSLGNPVDIVAIEKLTKKYDLMLIEDMAHCVGVKYSDGRECGTVGIAAAFSFGKDKVIDTISGGAVTFRVPVKHRIEAPSVTPKKSDHLRARFYPLFGGICRGLTRIHLGGLLMRFLVAIHWVEKSADNRLDLKRRISKFEAKLALEQFKALSRADESPIRRFYLVNNREEVLKQLAHAGYHFDGLWYKQPVSPERYYKKIHFPEETCPNSVYVAKHIINFPNYYSKSDLESAMRIIKPFLVEEDQWVGKTS